MQKCKWNSRSFTTNYELKSILYVDWNIFILFYENVAQENELHQAKLQETILA